MRLRVAVPLTLLWLTGLWLTCLLLTGTAAAAAPHFRFRSWFGGYDKAQLQVGFATYQANCASCHGLSLVRPDQLQTLGLTAAEVTGLLKQAKPQPPKSGPPAGDLSLFEAGHRNGAAYVQRLLLGYRPAPPDITLLPGEYYNVAYPGGQIAMAPSLKPGSVHLAGGKTASTPQMAHDVAAFLAWSADPTLDDRKSIGLRAIIFLIIFGIVGFVAMRRPR